MSHAINTVGDAWLAQFRGNSWISRAIKYGTGGVHSHSAIFRRTDCASIDVLELREFAGGRAQPIEAAARQFAGQIDVFSIDLHHFPEFDCLAAVEKMRHLTGRRYGYRGVLRLALMKVPLLWRLWPLKVTDDHMDDAEVAPFCSHAVCWAYRVGGGVDPVPNKPDDRVSPNDLTSSLLFRYEFTL